MQPKTTTLYFTSGKSDKVYKASLLASADGWLVNYEYGKRNAILKSALKTPAPLDYEKAHKVYESLVKSKKSKGYTEEESGSAYSGSDVLADLTGFQPQLLKLGERGSDRDFNIRLGNNTITNKT